MVVVVVREAFETETETRRGGHANATGGQGGRAAVAD
jgi:hypothetical protein